MKKYAALFFSLGLVLGLNLYLRSLPIYFPQLKARAREVVDQMILQGVSQDVYNKFPQFNPLVKERIIKNRIAEFKKINKKIIGQQVKEGYKQLKDRYQDENGQTYLMELDCWHWGRYVENVVKLGHPGDEVVHGEQWDLLMLAPQGSYLLWEQFLYYLSAFLYKIFSLFKVVPIFTFLFYLPLLYAAIFTIVLFFFSLRYGGYLGAIASSLYVGLSPILLQRSCAGWFDTDILNLLLPLLVVWAYILAYDTQSLKKRLFWICFSGFWVGLFCFTWTHWWFVFLILIIHECISLGYLGVIHFYFKNKQLPQLKQHVFSLLTFIFFSFFWVVILAGFSPIEALYKQILQAVILNKPLMASIWPNVYSTVGELRTMGFNEIANSAGGMVIFICAIISMAIILVNSLRDRKIFAFKREAILILVIWFLSMLFASSRGIRFVFFLPLPLGICLCWLINDSYTYFKNKKNIWGIILVVVGFLVFSGVCINRGYNASTGLYPLIDDTWYKVLNVIKDKTPEKTILNSWWDYGDWFKSIARRRVIFDGQSQDKPQAYWMAKSMLTDDENEAIAILRMLNNGGNEAFEIINKYVKDELQSVLLLESLLPSKPEEAQQKLLDFLPAPAVEKVLGLLFSTPSRACFIVDNTMVPKMAAISYLGTWDFSKVYIAKNFNSEEKDRIIERLVKLGRNKQEVQRFYQEAFLLKPENLDDWLSRRILFYSGLTNGREKDGIVYFDNGFIYNPKEQAVRSNNGQIPRSLFVLNDFNLTETAYPNANVIFSLFVMKDKDNYRCVLLDRELANSIFVRLYFFNGMGLRHFAPFIDADEGGEFIRVFNISW